MGPFRSDAASDRSVFLSVLLNARALLSFLSDPLWLQFRGPGWLLLGAPGCPTPPRRGLGPGREAIGRKDT